MRVKTLFNVIFAHLCLILIIHSRNDTYSHEMVSKYQVRNRIIVKAQIDKQWDSNISAKQCRQSRALTSLEKEGKSQRSKIQTNKSTTTGKSYRGK